MLGPPRQEEYEIEASLEHLQATKDATSLASFSTTGGSRGSSAVASHCELPEHQQGAVVPSSTQLGRGTTLENDSAIFQNYIVTQALDDYLASPQVTECSLLVSDGGGLPKGRCRTAAPSLVTREELECWTQQVHGQLNVVMDVMTAKLSQCRARMADKDEVIKRLHWRLQNYESQSGPIVGVGGGSANSRTPQRRAVRGSSGGVVGVGSGRGADAPCSPTGVAAARANRSVEGTSASSSVSAVSCRSGSPLSGGPQVKAIRAARETSQRDNREQARDKGDQPQIAYLRQEIAQMRRRNNELSAQVRQRETQMDGLTNMIKEMQVTAQRQSGLFKRQLHLRDDTLLQMQEELLATRGATATSATPGSASSTTRQSDVDINASRATPPLNGIVSGTGVAVSSSARRPQLLEIGAASPSLSRSAASATQSQVPRAARRPTDGGTASERGSSAARSLSAFARHKEARSRGSPRGVIVRRANRRP